MSAAKSNTGKRTGLTGGFTLLEMAIALALWTLLALGALSVLRYASYTSSGLVAKHEAFELARASLEALTVNLQLADTIKLETEPDGTLKRLTLTERGLNGSPTKYKFFFKSSAKPGEAKYHRLEFGDNVEFASHIEMVRLVLTNGRMDITVVTDDTLGPPLTLTGSVDVRYKTFE